VPGDSLPACLLWGLDSLYVSYFFRAKQSQIDWDDLAYRKERLRADGNAEGAEISLGSQRFMLQPYGSKPYSYVLRNRTFVVRLAENLNPCCNVQFLSEGLWKHGVSSILTQFDLWAESVDLSSSRLATVGRADWAFDFGLKTVNFNEDCFVSLASKDAKHRKDGRPQTFTFGNGDKVVRVYDKVAEIQEASGKTYFYELWGQEENVWRVEFQVRGDGLKEAGIRALPDLFAGEAELLRHLARKHTSLRLPSQDGNRSRWPFHSLWSALLQVIDHLPQHGQARKLDSRLPIRLRVHEQQKSLYGHMKSLGTLFTILEDRAEPLTLHETVARLNYGLIADHHHPAEWKADIEDRRTRFELGEW